MSKIVLKVEDLSKQYRLGTIGTGTISDDLNRWWHKVRGKEDPYSRVGEVNDRSSKGESEYVMALNDINFEVSQGEILGIIGKNGAGKSTLLKILSKVTGPTTGTIKAKGRVASLLEVGTGFHPELTGRENIFLNGALLGMTKKEIAKKLDAIIAFAGVERYIDTPVKRYSSGMRVRLGFAVAAFLEPEILIVDEVLAVGDATFQKKAIGKMQEVSKGGGRTVLFVSHNMDSIKSLCTRCLLLENGTVKSSGSPEDIIKDYLENKEGKVCYSKSWNFNRAPGNEFAKFLGYKITNSEGNHNLFIQEDINFEIKYWLDKNTKNRIDISLHIFDSSNRHITVFATGLALGYSPKKEYSKGENSVLITIPNCGLNKGVYSATLFIIENSRALFWAEEIMNFEIQAKSINGAFRNTKGIILSRISARAL